MVKLFVDICKIGVYWIGLVCLHWLCCFTIVRVVVYTVSLLIAISLLGLFGWNVYFSWFCVFKFDFGCFKFDLFVLYWLDYCINLGLFGLLISFALCLLNLLVIGFDRCLRLLLLFLRFLCCVVDCFGMLALAFDLVCLLLASFCCYLVGDLFICVLGCFIKFVVSAVSSFVCFTWFCGFYWSISFNCILIGVF